VSVTKTPANYQDRQLKGVSSVYYQDAEELPRSPAKRCQNAKFSQYFNHSQIVMFEPHDLLAMHAALKVNASKGLTKPLK